MAGPFSIRGVMSLKETPLLGKSGTSRMWRDISSVAASLKLLLQESPSGGKAVDDVRHHEGHTRDLDVPLCQLSIAAYDADGEQFFDKTCLAFYSVGQLLLSVGPILQDTRQVAARVTTRYRHAALNALLYDLQREVLLILKSQNVTEHLDVLRSEQPVSPTGAG